MNAKPGRQTQQPTPGTAHDDLLRTIKVVCQACGRKYRLDARYSGRHLKCRNCGVEIAVPNDVELRARPAEARPGWLVVLWRWLSDILTGRGKPTPIRRSRWMTLRQSNAFRVVAGSVLAVLFVVAGVRYWDSDGAKIRFGRAEGKEIAFRQIVELEEEIATALAGVRTIDAADDVASSVRSRVRRQNRLWDALADWKTDGGLTEGETNLLRTRYRDRFRKANAAVMREQYRVVKLGDDMAAIIDALRERSGDAAISRRIVLTDGKF